MARPGADRIERGLRGTVAAAVTPFDADGRLDEAGIARNAEASIAEGADSLLLLGSMGEHVVLDEGEWDAVVRSHVAAVAGRVPIFTAVGHTDQRVMLGRAERAMALGADALVVLPPYYFPLSPAETFDVVAAVAALGHPFVTYSNPTTGGPAIAVAELARIAELRGFRGAKDATPNVVEFAAKRRMLPARFPLVAAAETPLAYTLLAGADGVCTAAATFAPGFIARMLAARDASDVAALMALDRRLQVFRALVDTLNRQGSAGYLPVAKAALDWRGLAGGAPRPPVRALDAALSDRLFAILAESFDLAAGA
jgi:4-hydroxy-tetrahydrodipicolinate synthase